MKYIRPARAFAPGFTATMHQKQCSAILLFAQRG
jgi:hypothetical protein